MARKKPTAAELRRLFATDFAAYAPRHLKIRDKAGNIVPLELNFAQRHIHAKVEQQLRETGKVRAVVLKGRQQGASTYIEGRAYWFTTTRPGKRTFILTHLAEATDNLFKMALRYHQHCPRSMRPTATSETGKRLEFGQIDSDYAVGTAGTQATGRSSTVQFFHGSEVAYWPHAEEHVAGILQAVPEEPGTEIWYESTANGVGGAFHEAWQAAEAGASDFVPIFVPWYWQQEYRREPEPGFSVDDDEAELMEIYGLDESQIAWRRHKVSEMKLDLFQREYPNTPAEAFAVSGVRALLDPDLIAKAMIPNGENELIQPIGPTVMGVDPARFGDDRTGVALRTGRVVHWVQSWSRSDTMDTVGRVKRLLDEHNPDRCFVDVIGIGAGVVDRLREMGYAKVVGASASAKPLDSERYINKRGEMYGEFAAWLEDRPCRLPQDDALRADLMGIMIKRYDSKGRIQLESKDEAKMRGVRSPDLGDAVVLTFFEPVAEQVERTPVRRRGSGGWMG